MAYTSFKAADRSYTALIKKDIHRMAAEAGFPVRKIDEIDIVVAEITSNLNKYGKDGELLVMVYTDEKQSYLEIIAIDHGPGMSDPLRMIEDGVSTSGTLGQGLGAIKRLSDCFELYSMRNWGTILLSRIFSKPAPAVKSKGLPVFRYLVVPKPGEEVSGDGCLIYEQDNLVKVLVGDGLGHGKEANKAVNTAGEAFKESRGSLPSDIIKDIHAHVKKTRGLVGVVAVFDKVKKNGLLCGIGNIATKSFSASQAKNHVSYNGIIGMNIPGSIKDQDIITGDVNQYIVMCSDGIRSQWEPTKFPGILKHDLTILAAAIYKDFARKTDDMSVVVGKIN